MSRNKNNWNALVDERGQYYNPDIDTGGGGGQKGQKGEIGPSGGQKGEKGDAGGKGEAGTNGTNGVNGTKGQKGVPGTKGADGQKGAANDKGQKGASGSASAKGDKGIDGPKGQKGQDGATGDKGQKGLDGNGDKGQKGDGGDKGEKGLDGNGDKGQKGQDGAATAKGQKGDDGQKGQDGSGDKGSKGAQGNAADKGDKGTKGSNGTGDKGEKGIDGPKGQKGTKGAEVKGQKGGKGEKGAPAPLLQFQGSVANEAALPAQPQPAGDTYFNLETGRYVTSDGAAWGDAGQMIKGDKGQDIKGEKGFKGTKGADAAKGQKGGDGPKGEKGGDGPTGPKGSANDKGEKGIKGANIKGDQGDKGQKGTPSPLLDFQGNVANQAALPTQPQTAGHTYLVVDENLYYSSDGAAWNPAGTVVKGEKGLKGLEVKGDKGDKGVKGQKGVDGEKGQKGIDGDKGQKGEDGQKGDKGEKGGKGEKGQKGTKGEVGDKGEKGEKGQKGFKGTVGAAPAAGVSAHVNFNGGTANGAVPAGDINASHEITGVEKLGTGNWRITFANAFAGAEAYTCVGAISNPGTGLPSGVNLLFTNQTTTTVEVYVERSDNGNQFDPVSVQCAFYGTGTGGAVVQKGEKGGPGGQKGQKGFQGPKGQKGKKGLKGLMPVGAAQAHVAFDASSGAAFNFASDVSSSFNVSNIIRNATGDFTISFDSAFADANYTVIASAGGRDHSSATGSNRSVNVISRAANSVNILCETGGGNNDDADYIAICVYGTGSQGNVQTGPKGQKGFKGEPDGDKGTKGQKGFKGDKGQKGIKGQVPAGAVTAHISFNGEASTGTISGSDIFSSFGISQLVKNSTGDYTVTFSDAFTADDTYTVTGSAGGRSFTASSRTVTPIQMNSNNCNFQVERSDTGAQDDVPYVSIIFYGNGTGGLTTQKGEKGVKGESGGQKGTKGNEGNIGFDFSYVSFDASGAGSFAWPAAEITSNGIAQVVRLGTAEYRVDFQSAYSSGDYMVQITTSSSSSAANSWAQITSRTGSSLTFQTRQNGNSYSSTGEAADTLDFISVSVSGT